MTSRTTRRLPSEVETARASSRKSRPSPRRRALRHVHALEPRHAGPVGNDQDLAHRDAVDLGEEDLTMRRGGTTGVAVDDQAEHRWEALGHGPLPRVGQPEVGVDERHTVPSQRRHLTEPPYTHGGIGLVGSDGA
jgi:hypothetical protein